MDSFKRNIIITGGAGFIGSHVVRLFVNKYPEYRIINLDKLTYAGNLANLKDIEDKPNYIFVKADICDFGTIQELLVRYQVDGIIHLAAESHVDRSIKVPPMKYMGHWNLTGLSSRRKPNISLIVRILQVRQVVITLFVLFMTHMVCLPL